MTGSLTPHLHTDDLSGALRGRQRTPTPMPVPGAVKRLVLKGLAAASSRDSPDRAARAGEGDAGRRGPTAHWGIVPFLGPLARSSIRTSRPARSEGRAGQAVDGANRRDLLVGLLSGLAVRCGPTGVRAKRVQQAQRWAYGQSRARRNTRIETPMSTIGNVRDSTSAPPST